MRDMTPELHADADLFVVPATEVERGRPLMTSPTPPKRSSLPGQLVELRPARHRVIAVSGGKGGVGKSTLSTNLAAHYASLGSKTLLMDGDLGMADLNLLLGVAPAKSLLDLLRGDDADEVLVDAWGLKLLPALNGSYALANLSDELRAGLTRTIARLATRFETLVVDTAAGIDQDTMAMVNLASEALVVATSDPLSLADAYACVKVLSRHHGMRRAYVVPNNVRTPSEGDAIVAQLTKLTSRFLDIELVPLPAVPHEPLVASCAAEGAPLVLARPDSNGARAIRKLARTLDTLAMADRESRDARARLLRLAGEVG